MERLRFYIMDLESAVNSDFIENVRKSTLRNVS